MFTLGSNPVILWCLVLLFQLWPKRMHISSTLCDGEKTEPVVIFSSGHQQTHPVGNQVLYWQFSSALNTIPWMTNTECREQGSRYCHCMGQASLTKGFWRSAKADFWRKLKGDKMVGSAALHTPPRLQAPISHSLKEKKN